MRLRGGKERRMRRKLFLFAVILTGTVFLMTGFFPDLWIASRAEKVRGMTSHEGTVLSVKIRDNGTVLSIRDPEGVMIRGICYEPVEDIWKLTGKVITYASELTYGDPARNPHCFDYRKYIRSSGHVLTGNVHSLVIKGEDRSISMRYAAFLAGLRYSFENKLPERGRSMISGMLFGDTEGISDDIKEDFRKNGTAHILAVSGLHVGLLYSIYDKLTGNNRSPYKMLILTFLLYTYGDFTMWSPSVMRAEIMIIMKELARIKELRYDSMTSMSLAAVILIFRNPYVIYSMGFQMSFLAIISINVISPRLPERIPEALRQAISVNASLIFFQAYTFNYISPFAVLINVPVIFMAGIAIPVSFITFAIYSLTYAFGIGVMDPLMYVPAVSVTEMLIKLNSVLTLEGMNSAEVVSPPIFAVLLVSGIMLFLCSEYANILDIRKNKKRTAAVLALILAVSAVAGVIIYEPSGSDEIVFVDVGQGACTHIRAGEKNILIDGGGKRDRNIGDKVLKPYLLKNSVRSVELSLATHEDTDHIKGLYELAECFRASDPVTGALAGDSFRVSDNVSIDVIWPEDIRGEKQGNEESSVFMINYMGIRILVTGDLDRDGEIRMIEHYRALGSEDRLQAEVLNVGHHGSAGSTSDELLDIVSPGIAVIQVGKNSYGHPSEEVLERLYSHGVTVFRNDIMGAIGLDIKGKKSTAYISAVHVMIDDHMGS